jgi:hypothetical protein
MEMQGEGITVQNVRGILKALLDEVSKYRDDVTVEFHFKILIREEDEQK